ncbi:MAG: 50S ribosomal protein L9 [Alphaproteobacteria bacterium]|nr:50S ribosomal protein L9 [Alphaproteobacteria bacterium]
MHVILLERVGRLGTIGDEVTVRNGFARNYLLPKGKALRANAANRTRFEAERSVIEERNEERRGAAGGIAGSIDGKNIVMIRQAGETGHLYGSVSSRDIAEALVADGFEVVRSQVDLNTPIKTVGLHPVVIHLHAEVTATVKINAARSEEEAERQARGEDVRVVSYDDDLDDIEPDAEDQDDDADDQDADDQDAGESDDPPGNESDGDPQDPAEADETELPA